MTDFDPEAFRKFEHEGWNRLYEGYHSEWEHLTTQTIDNMLVEAGVSDGNRILDLACGPGYCAIRASEKGAEVIGIDLSENMIELAKKLAQNVDFRVGDAEELPFGDDEFDAVLINFGMLHFPNPEKVLAEVFRVLKPNGKLAFTAWAGPEGSALGIILNAVKKEGSLEVDLPAGTPLFRFANHEDCSQTLQKIGFSNIKSADHVLTWELPAADALFDSFKRATARTSGLLSAQEPSAIPAIRTAITKACMPFVVEGGRLKLPMPCCLTTAQKPA